MSDDTPEPTRPTDDTPFREATPPHTPDQQANADQRRSVDGPTPNSEDGSAAKQAALRPQRNPPLPRSRFTRHLIDYVGGGQYQLSAQGTGEGIVPLARADSPAPLLMIASQTSEPGDELIIAPAVALIDVVCMESTAIGLLQSRGQDPFDRIGNALTKRPDGDPASDLPSVLGVASDQRDPVERREDERSDGPAHGSEIGTAGAELPEMVRELLDRDRKTGGRLGWIFRVERASDDAESEGQGEGA